MPTLHQLSLKGRKKKRRRSLVAALKGAPQRKGVVVKMRVTTPRKPNSAKRRYARVRVLSSKKLISAHPPGLGSPYIQEYSMVLIEGGSPPDTPGINYSLIRGVYDFCVVEDYGRSRRRSKFGALTPFHKTKAPKYFGNKKKEFQKNAITYYSRKDQDLTEIQVKALTALKNYKDKMRNLYIKNNNIKGLVSFELKKQYLMKKVNKKEIQKMRKNTGFLPKLINFFKYRFKEQKKKQMWKVEKILKEQAEEQKRRGEFFKYIGNMITFYREKEKKRKKRERIRRFEERKKRLNEKKKNNKK